MMFLKMEMKMSFYNSFEIGFNSGRWLRNTFISEPYAQASIQFTQARQSNRSLGNRIVKVISGCLLLIPLVNKIVLMVIKYFERSSQVPPLQSQPLNERIILQNNLDNGRINRQNNLPNNDVRITINKDTSGTYEEIDRLASEHRYREAWHKLVLANSNPYENPESLYLNRWTQLPSKILICGFINNLHSTEEILSYMKPTLIRDCAIAYPLFAQKCLDEEILWNCLLPSWDEIADICKQNVSFAYQLITSSKIKSFEGNQYRFEILNAAYSEIIKSILASTMNDEQMENLAFFLLRHSIVVHDEDYKKVENILDAFQKQAHYSKAKTLFNFVLGKFSFQGVFQEGKNLFIGEENFIQMLNMCHSAPQEIEIAERIINSEVDDRLQKSLFFLSFIKVDAPNYHDSRMIMGRLLMENEQHIEAGLCFLQAACQPSFMEEGLPLAATSLLLKVNEEESFRYVSRNKHVVDEEHIQELNIEDVRSLTTNKHKFYSLLLQEFEDHPEIVSSVKLLMGLNPIQFLEEKGEEKNDGL
jgi:hypothetical protein